MGHCIPVKSECHPKKKHQKELVVHWRANRVVTAADHNRGIDFVEIDVKKAGGYDGDLGSEVGGDARALPKAQRCMQPMSRLLPTRMPGTIATRVHPQ